MTTKRTTRVSRSLDVWLAGRIGQDAYATMAQRLAWEVSEPGARPPTLVLYEPEPSITIGRAGSRTDVQLTDDELVSRQLAVRFVGRGGGAVLHGPGQVGIALFATLEDLGLDHYDVGGYLDRFESALEGAVREVRCGTARDSKISGVFGRTGLLAAVGVAIRRGVVWHGGFLNVERNSLPTHRVQTTPLAVGSALRTMSSIEADVQRRVRLQDARSALVHQMVESFGFPQPHIQSGCPVFVSAARLSEPVSRAG
jgi:lipoyl(octanoyl) transferase